MFALLSMLMMSQADAYVYWGNPELKLEIQRAEGDLLGGTADLRGVRVHKCAGGYTDYFANQVIDPVAGWTVQITGGDLCGVQVRWDSDVEVWSDTFELSSSKLIHAVSLQGTVSEGPFAPFTVTSGAFSGSNPKVRITIQ